VPDVLELRPLTTRADLADDAVAAKVSAAGTPDVGGARPAANMPARIVPEGRTPEPEALRLRLAARPQCHAGDAIRRSSRAVTLHYEPARTTTRQPSCSCAMPC
jgi:hypothetical protein